LGFIWLGGFWRRIVRFYGLFRRGADGGMPKGLVESESISINGESNSHGG
jgi:hypothetical protein